MKNQMDHLQLDQVVIEEDLENEHLWDSRKLGSDAKYTRPVQDSLVVKIKRLIEEAKAKRTQT